MAQRSRINLYFFGLVLLAVVGFNLVMVAPYLLAVVMGGILAILTRPLYRKLATHGLGAKTAALLVVLGSLVVVLVPLGFFCVNAATQAVDLGKYLLEHGNDYYRRAVDLIGRNDLFHRFVPDFRAFEPRVRASLDQGLKSGVAMFAAFLAQTPAIGLQIALALIAMFFFLVDGERLSRWVRGKIPMDSDVRRAVVETVRATTISTIWATVAAAGVQAALVFLGFLALGVPQAALASGATFVFAWIPILGCAPVIIVGAIYLYASGAYVKLALMIALGLFTGIADNLTRPWVLRGQSDLHPLVGLVAIFGGISIFGIWGVFIGPIAVAVLLSLLEVWPRVGRHFGLLPPTEILDPAALPPQEPPSTPRPRLDANA